MIKAKKFRVFEDYKTKFRRDQNYMTKFFDVGIIILQETASMKNTGIFEIDWHHKIW